MSDEAITAATDQMAAMMRGIAEMVTSYYVSLIGGGLDHSLIDDLVANWHDLYWRKTLGFPAPEDSE